MAFTLSEMISGSLRKMGVLKVSYTTSSGNSTTAIDASLIGQTSDDDYKYAPFFVLTAASSGPAAGEFGEVVSYLSGTGTFGFSTGIFSSTFESSMTYGVGTPEFRMKFLVEIANDALRGLGDLENVDTATIGTSAGVDEYTFPVAMKRMAPLRVDVQTNISSSLDANDWVTLHDWEYQPSGPSSAGTLILPGNIATGRDLRVWYVAQHGRITAYNAAIDERVHPELAILAMTEKLYEYRNSMNRGSMAFDVQRWNDAKTQLAEAKIMFPAWKSRRKPTLFVLGDGQADHLPYPPPYGP